MIIENDVGYIWRDDEFHFLVAASFGMSGGAVVNSLPQNISDHVPIFVIKKVLSESRDKCLMVKLKRVKAVLKTWFSVRDVLSRKVESLENCINEIEGFGDEGVVNNSIQEELKISKLELWEWCLVDSSMFVSRFRGNSRDTTSSSYGGVLRNYKGDVSAIFSGPVVSIGADFAELVAIRTALEFFKETKEIGKSLLCFESDSQHFKRNQRSDFVYVLRASNSFADYLAKSGANRNDLFKVYW
ncbi:hypothetical protein GQ457_12G019540 [Hibiscus cannabinus]